MIDPKLIEYARTDRQREVLALLAEVGSKRAVANQLGITPEKVRRALYAVERYAAEKGYAPQHGIEHPLPEHLLLSGTSTLTDMVTGEHRLQWLKSSLDRHQLKASMIAAANALGEVIKPEEPVAPPKHTLDDLMNTFILTDFHVGALSWLVETGEAWDMQIAEETVYKWIASSVKSVPPAKHAVLCQLGDFLHYDSLDAVTPANRNILDSDTRYGKLPETAIRIVRRLIRALLQHHETVTVIMAEGNHDPAGSSWLRALLKVFYENEPRVEVDDSKLPFYCVEWGQTSVYFHHGHLVKPGHVSKTFAGQFREVFGRTQFSYGHLGHMHHTMSKEDSLMVIEQHETLAARDSYSARLGHISQRSAPVITYHKNHGEVYRHRMPFSMIWQEQE